MKEIYIVTPVGQVKSDGKSTSQVYVLGDTLEEAVAAFRESYPNARIRRIELQNPDAAFPILKGKKASA